MNKGESETNGELYLAVELYEPLKTTPENYAYAECDNNSVSYSVAKICLQIDLSI